MLRGIRHNLSHNVLRDIRHNLSHNVFYFSWSLTDGKGLREFKPLKVTTGGRILFYNSREDENCIMNCFCRRELVSLQKEFSLNFVGWTDNAIISINA